MATPNEFGGYEYRFVSDPSDALVCKICFHPCRNPYLTGCCGHNFCKTCLDAARRTATNCPFCRIEDFATLPNKLSGREIRSLHVLCTNKERGCEWQGELNDINNHLGNSDGCQIVNVNCTNECGKMLQRQYLTSHVETECPRRKVGCQYCYVAGEHQFIDGDHKKLCRKLLLLCPNKCEIGSVPREHIIAHRKECPLEIIMCSNKCQKKLQRRHLISHVKTECPRRQTYCQYCHVAGEYQFVKGEHKEQCPKFPMHCPNKCKTESILREDMEIHRKECPFEVVWCEYQSVGCEWKMWRKDLEKHNNAKMKEHLSLIKLELTRSKEQLSTTVSTVLKQVDVAFDVLTKKTVKAPSCRDAVPFISIAKQSIRFSTMNKKFSTHLQSSVCPLIVSVPEYSKRKLDEAEWYSDVFYSHVKGYKMCLHVYPAGDKAAMGTHLSVFLRLIEGPNDDELTWPLSGKIEVKLLNQINDCEHHSMTIDYDYYTPYSSAALDGGKHQSFDWGIFKFISNKDLHEVTPTCQYLKDDCIFLQVSKL